jgi:hypothetical protein
VAHFHSQRLAWGKSYGRRDGLELALDTTADLLAEWTGWRQRRTFGDALDAWLADEYGLEAELQKVLIDWVSARPLPITRIETSLVDAGLALAAMRWG